MSRVNLNTANVPAASQDSLTQIHRAFGATPNMFKAVANSPAALHAMWEFFGALGKGRLGARLGEQIAAAIANSNRCEYCLAAHTALGAKAGVSAADMHAAQRGISGDPKTQAVLRFALKIVAGRAQIEAGDIAALREHGYDDEQIVEIVAHVALNLFTNYVNVALDVPLDFPAVALAE